MASTISVSSYAFAPPTAALDEGNPIQLSEQNQAASLAIQENLAAIQQEKYQLVIVPGYTPIKTDTPTKITSTSEKRLANAVKAMQKKNIRFIMTSGGNVHPDGTPFNEAFGMKTYLLQNLGISEDQIIIDPYALHSTTNLRNCGRFMLTYGLSRALVVTSFDQNFYFSFQGISTFAARSKKILGYSIGKFGFVSPNSCSFIPSEDVFTRGDTPLDP